MFSFNLSSASVSIIWLQLSERKLKTEFTINRDDGQGAKPSFLPSSLILISKCVWK